MSHTHFAKTTTNQRGRRGRGRGNLHNSNVNGSNNPQPNYFNEEYSNENNSNPRRDGNRMQFKNNRGNKQPNRGHNTSKRTNNSDLAPFKRSHSSGSSSSSRNGNGQNAESRNARVQDGQTLVAASSRLPKHAQNPIFTNELMQRFTSILPSFGLLASEASDLVQPSVTSAQNRTNDSDNSFASISNNLTHGFRPPSHRPEESNSGLRNFDESQSNVNRNRNQTRRQFSGNDGSTIPDHNVTQFPSDSNRNQYPRNSESTNPRVFKDDKKVLSRNNYGRNNGQHQPNHFARGNNRSPQRGHFNTTEHRQPVNDIDKRNNILRSLGFAGNVRFDNNSKTVEAIATYNQNRASQSVVDASLSFHLGALGSGGNNSNQREPSNEIPFRGVNPSMKNFTGGDRRKAALTENNNFAHELPRQIDSYNRFLDSQAHANSQDQNERLAFPVQQEARSYGDGRSTVSSNSGYSNLTPSHDSGLTQGIVAGNFNIRQAVAGPGQRVASRQDAVRSLQGEYNIQAVQHQIKQKEKEAKKRDERLARYSHIDQGHRLTEAYLDEAAGYDPGLIAFLESEEEVRQRQQDQLRRDALVFQERQREEEERMKKREEAKQKEMLAKKNKFVDAGYKLGKNGNQAPGTGPPYMESEEEVRQRQQDQFRRDAILFQERQRQANEQVKRRDEEKQKRDWEQKNKFVDAGYRLGRNNSQGGGDINCVQPRGSSETAAIHADRVSQGNTNTPQEKQVPSDINKEFLLEGETEEEAYELQQEQILLEAMIWESREKEEQQLKTLTKSFPKQEQPKKPSNLDKARLDSILAAGQKTSSGLRGKVHTPSPASNSNASNSNPQQKEKIKEVDNVREKNEKEELKEKLLSQLETLMSTSALKPPVQAQVSQVETLMSTSALKSPVQAQVSQLETLMSTSALKSPVQAQEPKLVLPPKTPPQATVAAKPASCVLKKSSQEAVLVLRPSENALQSTLISRLEVHDEMDKLGKSSLYNPQIEREPLYSNNRFERRAWPDMNIASGADTEQKTLTLPRVPAEGFSQPDSEAVSVRRPSQDVLQAMLIKVQDEMDKLGTSSEYKPRLEQEHLYSNIRFEHGTSTDMNKASGADPKQKTLTLPSVPTEPAEASSEPEEAAPAIDYQAEMRAARLRMQQKYEETLKKQQQDGS